MAKNSVEIMYLEDKLIAMKQHLKEAKEIWTSSIDPQDIRHMKIFIYTLEWKVGEVTHQIEELDKEQNGS